MDPRIAAAEAALSEGQPGTAAALLSALLAEAPDAGAKADLLFARALYMTGRHAEGLAHTAAATARHPGDAGLWNLHGAMLRVARRPAEALAAFDRSLSLDAEPLGPRANRAATLLDLGRATEAAVAFAELAERDPAQPSHTMNAGRALARLGRPAEAEQAFRAALAIRRDYPDAWRQLAALRHDQGDGAGAEAALDEGLEAVPDSVSLMEAKVLLLRTLGQRPRAEAWLQALPMPYRDQAWARIHLGDLLGDHDRAAANAEYRRAFQLEPTADHRALLIQSLGRSFGPEEGAALDEACGLIGPLLTGAPVSPGQSSIAGEILLRAGAFADFDRLGRFADLGRSWAASGRHTALFRLLSRVTTDADRRELIAQHRLWGDARAAEAQRTPLKRPSARTRDSRIRLGFLSSDLRRHPVGYFALPLFDHADPERFELFAYSAHRGPGDDLQAAFARRCVAFREAPDATPRQIAQTIADDGIDMLIELGGSTQGNRLEAMAWKPAPKQASWLGYPHSTGVPTIDHFICDPYNLPPDPALLLEAPLVMPATWIALGGAVFNQDPPIDPTPPQDRHGGRLTFGTANNPHKYTPAALRAWARATAAVPGARFAFLRPEGASQAFRRNMLAAFAAEGVGEDRVIFHAVRGQHLAWYNEIDITLDTFPLTGGTTTVEALWMGVPVVSLRGPAFYERLSWSILANAGLSAHSADDEAGFLRIAAELAEDRAARIALRQGLRGQLQASPLGRTRDFAREFYDLIARTLGG